MLFLILVCWNQIINVGGNNNSDLVGELVVVGIGDRGILNDWLSVWLSVWLNGLGELDWLSGLGELDCMGMGDRGILNVWLSGLGRVGLGLGLGLAKQNGGVIQIEFW